MLKFIEWWRKFGGLFFLVWISIWLNWMWEKVNFLFVSITMGKKSGVIPRFYKCECAHYFTLTNKFHFYSFSFFVLNWISRFKIHTSKQLGIVFGFFLHAHSCFEITFILIFKWMEIKMHHINAKLLNNRLL